MPTNTSPEYKKAEEAYRAAREPKDRLDCLKEMARTIPKHKGTEHLQADIKTRIKQLTEELAGPKKGGLIRAPLRGSLSSLLQFARFAGRTRTRLPSALSVSRYR